MTPNEFVTFIKEQLGFRSDQDGKIIRDANVVQRRLEDDESFGDIWFLTREYSDVGFVTTAGEKNVAIPTSYLSDAEEHGGLYIYDTSLEDPYVELTRDDSGLIRAAFAGSSGRPSHYDLVGSNLEFGPVPDAEYTLRWFAKFRDASIIAGGATNQWLTHAPYLLAGETGMIVASAVQNAAAIQFFTSLAATERARFTAKTIEREADAAEMGGDD